MKQKIINIRDIPEHAFRSPFMFKYFPRFFDDFSEQKVLDLIDSRCVSGIGLKEGELTPNGVFQILLLQTAPFRFDGSLTEHKDKILDIRNGTKFVCQDRPKLLEYFASTLVVEYRQCRYLTAGMEPRIESRLAVLEDIVQFLSSYFDLRNKGIITSKKSVKSIQRRIILKLLKMIEEIIKSLSERDYQLIVKHQYEKYPRRFGRYHIPRDDKKLLREGKPLLIGWRDHLMTYGPIRYPLVAILHVIATILIQFGIEEGSRTAVVSRIRKRLERSSK